MFLSFKKELVLQATGARVRSGNKAMSIVIVVIVDKTLCCSDQFLINICGAIKNNNKQNYSKQFHSIVHTLCITTLRVIAYSKLHIILQYSNN